MIVKKKNAFSMNLLMKNFYLDFCNELQLTRGGVDDDDDEVSDDELPNNLMSEKEAKQNNENLFDLIYNIHTKEFKEQFKADLGNDENNFVIENSNLKPLLRPYQINAVRWMLKKEKFNFPSTSKRAAILPKNSTESIHTLYTKVTDKHSQTFFYHKYLGV